MKKLVHFTADWCAPCKKMSPIIDDFISEYSGIEYVKVNVDEETEMVSEYSVMSVPTFVVLNDEKESKRHSGVLNKEELVKLFL